MRFIFMVVKFRVIFLIACADTPLAWTNESSFVYAPWVSFSTSISLPLLWNVSAALKFWHCFEMSVLLWNVSKGLVARSHSLLVFLHYIHSYKTHSFITFIEFRTSFLIAVCSGRGPPLGCPLHKQFFFLPRFKLGAAMMQPDDLPTEPCRTLTEPRRTLTEPRRTLTEPCPTLAEPRHTLTEPRCTKKVHLPCSQPSFIPAPRNFTPTGDETTS
jgi:hypothetical protein